MATNQKMGVKVKPVQDELWLDSKAVLKALKISSCELCHLRQTGNLQFKKRGNAYFYSGRDVQLILKREVPPRRR